MGAEKVRVWGSKECKCGGAGKVRMWGKQGR